MAFSLCDSALLNVMACYCLRSFCIQPNNLVYQSGTHLICISQGPGGDLIKVQSHRHNSQEHIQETVKHPEARNRGEPLVTTPEAEKARGRSHDAGKAGAPGEKPPGGLGSETQLVSEKQQAVRRENIHLDLSLLPASTVPPIGGP